MASPRPTTEVQRKDSNYDRERRRDGGKGQSVANPVQASGAATTDRRSTTARGDKGRETERDAGGEEGEDRIGPYVIGEEVGRGSFATVFKGARYVRSLPPPSQRPSVDITSLLCSISLIVYTHRTLELSSPSSLSSGVNSRRSYWRTSSRRYQSSSESLIGILSNSRIVSSVSSTRPCFFTSSIMRCCYTANLRRAIH